jgi:outer membrane immunogenic protein
MKFLSLTSAAALGLLAASSPALAQENWDRDTHFDGPYVSGFVGWGIQTNDRGERITFDTDGDKHFDDTVTTAAGANAFSPGFCHGKARGGVPADGCARDKDGIDYGGRLGWDKRMGQNFVVGGLLEFNKGNARDSTSAFSTDGDSYGITRKLDYAVSARARAGYTPDGGALFYVTGGASYAKLKHRFFTTNDLNDFDPQRNGKMIWGWQAGGGAEVMLTNNVSLGLEYLYNRYKDNKYRVEVTQGVAPPTSPFILDSGATDLRVSDRTFEIHSLRATVSYQF